MNVEYHFDIIFIYTIVLMVIFFERTQRKRRDVQDARSEGIKTDVSGVDVFPGIPFVPGLIASVGRPSR